MASVGQSELNRDNFNVYFATGDHVIAVWVIDEGSL